jgi:hypothetical protein
MSTARHIEPYDSGVPRVQPQGGVSPDGRCTAMSKTRRDRCGQPAVEGSSVCRYHGGSAPQVLEAARRRIAGPILQAAVDRHDKLIREGRNEAAVGAMIRDTYDRVGIGTEAREGDVEVRELLIRVRSRVERGTGPATV